MSAKQPEWGVVVALGSVDVAPREASVSVTRGDGGRTGDKELVFARSNAAPHYAGTE